MATNKLKDAAKTSKTLKATSATVSMTNEIKKSQEPPSGAKIIKKSIRTETEEIENGWLVTKNYDIKYEVKGNTDWTYYSEKYFSKTNPLKVVVEDKALADQFDDTDE